MNDLSHLKMPFIMNCESFRAANDEVEKIINEYVAIAFEIERLFIEDVLETCLVLGFSAVEVTTYADNSSLGKLLESVFLDNETGKSEVTRFQGPSIKTGEWTGANQYVARTVVYTASGAKA